MKPFSERLLDLLNDGDIERAMTHEDEDCIREAAALAKRYEDAPVGRLVCTSHGFMAEPEDMNDHRFWSAGRVRILLDTEGAT